MSGDDHDFVKRVVGWSETKVGPSLAWIDTSSRFAVEKIARAVGLTQVYVPPVLRQKIAELQGTLPKDKIAFYNRALGTFESYGINRNGDGWYRTELMRKHATFVDSAHYFRNHKNRVERGDPYYGRPVASAFNDKTDMVDLIIVGDFDKQAEEDLHRLERGLAVETSMGCRVKFDVCTVCGNQARKEDDYCEHVHKEARWPYGRGQVLTDGRVCGMMNPDPIFFDISRLPGGNPAFLGSENLLKVAMAQAHEGKAVSVGSVHAEAAVKSIKAERAAAGMKKTALGAKVADMIKRMPGRIETALVPDDVKIDALAPVSAKSCSCSKQVEKSAMTALVKSAGADAILGTATALGIVLSPEEFGYIAGASVETPTTDAILNAKVANVAEWPVSEKVAGVLAPLCPERSVLQPWALNRVSELVQSQDKIAHTVSSGDRQATEAYLAYRAGLLSTLSQTTKDGAVLATKVAGTQTRMVTKTSATLALLAFCHDAVKNVHDADSRNLAKQANVTDTLSCTLRVSGSMADDFGKDVLELMADNLLQTKNRSR